MKSNLKTNFKVSLKIQEDKDYDLKIQQCIKFLLDKVVK